MTPILQLDTSDKNLCVHPLLKHAHAWEADSEKFKEFADSIWENGVLEPIKITKNFEIVDGRHRWRAAKLKRLEKIPAVQVGDDQAASIIIATLINRRHYNASQRAYILAPMIKEAFEEAQRRLVKRSLTSGNTPFALHARSIGVSPKTLDAWSHVDRQ